MINYYGFAKVAKDEITVDELCGVIQNHYDGVHKEFGLLSTNISNFAEIPDDVKDDLFTGYGISEEMYQIWRENNKYDEYACFHDENYSFTVIAIEDFIEACKAMKH